MNPNSKPIRGQIAELTPELSTSLTFWIKYVQTIDYKEKVRGLTKQQHVPTRSSLSRLNTFVDEHGCIRVGERLQHALLQPDEKPLLTALAECFLKEKSITLNFFIIIQNFLIK